MLRQRLEGRVVTQATGNVTHVTFFITQYSEIDTGLLHDFDEGTQDALAAHIERTVTDPEQNVGFFHIRHQLQVLVRGPVHTAARIVTARVIRGDQVFQGFCTFVWRVAFFHGEEAAHIHDGVHVLDHHRALFHTGAAGRTGPQGFRRHQTIGDDHVRTTGGFTDFDTRIR